jgi:hypothetical protein
VCGKGLRIRYDGGENEAAPSVLTA